MKITLEKGFSEAIDGAASVAAPDHQFLTRRWFQAAGNAYGNVAAVTLVARRPDGAPVLALPLVSAGAAGLGAKQVPGSYWPFRSFPIASDATLTEMIEFLTDRQVRRALGIIWRMGPVYETDPALSLLTQAACHAGWKIVRRRVGTNFLLDLESLRSSGAWPRASTLKKNRYAEKQLSDLGGLRWHCFHGSDWSPALITDLASIEASSWVGTRTDRSAAKLLSANNRRFWEEVAMNGGDGGHVSAALLYVGPSPVAFSLDIDCPPCKYVIAISYDQAFSKHSPGKLLTYRNLAAATSKGIGIVDWGPGDSGYKSTIGASEGSEIVDCIFIRGRHLAGYVASVVGPLWTRSGQ